MLQDTTLDLFKYSPFPTLAQAVRSGIDSILQRWESMVRQKLPSAAQLTIDQLRDDLPSVLRHLADLLESSDAHALPSFEVASQGHGLERSRHSYSVNDVMVEYGLLRPIVLDVVSDHLGRHMTVPEVAALNMGIDTAARRSVARCVESQQQQLRMVSNAQSKYLSFLSHDLRGGLNGVMLTAELLKRQLADDPRFSESVEDIDAMRRSILDTVATMDRFLHAERFRQGRVRAARSVVDLAALLAALPGHFAHSLREKKLELKLDISKNLRAETDKDLLWLIVQNLVSNAIKYTPAGTVRVAAEPVNGTNGELAGHEGQMILRAMPAAGAVISVTDSGPGIPPEELPTLFEAFTRGDTHGEPGVGLGLYIVRQSADLINAKLTVESEPGQGATFRILLPGNAPSAHTEAGSDGSGR